MKTTKSLMRLSVIAVWLAAMAILLAPQAAHAATCTSVADGNWSNAANWTCGASPGPPGADDDVVINNTITLYQNVEVRGLKINSGKTLSGNSYTLTLGYFENNGGSFTPSTGTVAFVAKSGVTPGVYGTSSPIGFNNITISTGVDFGASGKSVINGTLTINSGGYVQVGKAPSYGSASTLKYASGGSYTAGEEWYPNTPTGPGVPQNVEIAAGTTLTFGSTTYAARTALGNVTINGTLTLSPAFGSDLNIGGNWVNNNIFNASSRLVTFYGASAHTIGGTVNTTFDYLTIADSTGVTLNRATTVNKTLTINSGGYLADNGYTLMARGDIANSGTHSGAGMIVLNGGSAAHALTGNGSYGNLELNDGGYGATLGGSPTIYGTLRMTAGTLAVGGQTLTLEGAVICGGGSITSDAGGTVRYVSTTAGQNVCAATYGNLVLNSANKILAASGTIGIAGAFTPGSATAHTTTGSTIRFNGASGAQTIPVFNYNNLTLNNSAGASLGGSVTVGSGLTLTSGNLGVGSNTLTLNSTVTCGTSSINSAAGGTVNYAQASTGQSVCGGTYGILTLSSYNKTLAGTATADGAFTLGPSTLTIGTNSLTLNSTVACSGGVISSNTTGTVSYAQGSAGQSVCAGTYGILTFSNYNKTLAGTATANGAFTLGSGTLTVGSYSLTLNSTVACGSGSIGSDAGGTVSYNQGSAGQNICAGSYRNLTFSNFNKILASSGTIGIAGAFTPGAATGHTVTGSTVSFNGASGAQTIPAFTFNNLTLNNSAGASLGGNVTVGGGLTLTSGNLAVGSNTLMLYSTVTCGTSSINSAAGGAVNYAQASNGQSVCGGTYGILGFSGYNKTLAGTATANGAFTLASGTLTIGTNSLTLNSTVTCDTGGVISSNATGTVSYAQTSTGQSVCGGTYGILTLSSYNKTLAGTATANGAFTLGSGTLTVGSYSLTLNSTVACGSGSISSYAGGTVSYNQGSAGQNVCAGSYRNLTFSNFNKILASSGTVGIAGAFTPGAATGHTTTGSTVSFNGASGAQTIPAFTFNNLTLNNSAGASLGGNVTVGGGLTLSNGLFRVKNNTLTISSAGGISGGSTSSIVVTDEDVSQTGKLCKAYSTNSTFTFPVGDARGTAEYSPSTLAFSAGFAGSTACVRVTNAKHPNKPSDTDYPTYISRYWTTSSTDTDFTCTASFVYTDADVTLGGTQTENALYHKVYSASTWTTKNQTTAGTNTLSSSVTSFSDHTAFSGSPLAVTLAAFTATTAADGVTLAWETVSETDNAGFNVYRAASGSVGDRPQQETGLAETCQVCAWVKLNAALIPSAAPGSSEGHAYTWTDATAAANTSYVYRLQAVALDGSTEILDTLGVTYRPARRTWLPLAR